MQITFNTEDNLEDLKNIHELIVNAIKKKGGQENLGVLQVKQQAAPQLQTQNPQVPAASFTSNPEPPTISRLANSPFASLLKAEQSSSLGSPIHSVSRPALTSTTTSDGRTGTIAKINEDYRRQYEESKQNPKPKGQNPEIDMSNIFMSDVGRREGRRLR